MTGNVRHDKYYELGLIALLTAFLAALKLAGFHYPWWLVTVPLGLVLAASVAGPKDNQ